MYYFCLFFVTIEMTEERSTCNNLAYYGDYDIVRIHSFAKKLYDNFFKRDFCGIVVDPSKIVIIIQIIQ